MYEDDELWPIKCSECKHEFLEKIGRIKTGKQVKCPVVDCPGAVWYPPKQFELAVAKAAAGTFDPFWDMLTLQKPA